MSHYLSARHFEECRGRTIGSTFNLLGESYHQLPSWGRTYSEQRFLQLTLLSI